MKQIGGLVDAFRVLLDQLGTDPDIATEVQMARSQLERVGSYLLDRDAVILSALIQADTALEAARINGPDWMATGFKDAHDEVNRVMTLMRNDDRTS